MKIVVGMINCNDLFFCVGGGGGAYSRPLFCYLDNKIVFGMINSDGRGVFRVEAAPGTVRCARRMNESPVVC